MSRIEFETGGPRPSPTVTLRDLVYVMHKGRPPQFHSPLATVLKKPDWPDNLWGPGELIYDVSNPGNCLPPAKDDILRFNSRFESGNLAKAYRLDDNVYHLLLEPDQDPTGLCQWFYFGITNVRKDVEYQFYLSGFHKEDNLFGNGATIFYYSEKRALEEDINWTHGGTDYAYAVTCRTRDHQRRSTLQFRIKFPYDDDLCYICYALPYTYSDLNRAIQHWKSSTPPGVVTHETLCLSMCGREVPVLTITSPESPMPLAGKSCIFLTGRIHPGESNGSYMLHGLIDWLLSDNPSAKYILDHCIVRIVPMIAVDGVIEGAYRIFSLSGFDLNRMWESPCPVKQPVVYHTKELIKKTAMERPIVVYIDFHGHSRLHGTFAFGCPNPSNVGLKDAEKMLPRLWSFLSDEFSWEHCIFSFPKERDAAGRIVVRRELGVVQSFTIETSFGACKAGRNAGMLYDEVLWKEVGAKCGAAIYHYLIPTASPLAAYVNKELLFFAANPNASKKGKKICKPRIFCAKNACDIETEVNAYPTNEDGSRKLLRTEDPTETLSCEVDSISLTPPEHLLTRWNTMPLVTRT